MGDLIDLDLAYSPPYGQAKDAVNLVGMVGSNVLDGTLPLWYAEDLEQVQREALLLDMRTAAEYATGHLPDSLNIPHTELRARLDEVREAATGQTRAGAVRLRGALGHRPPRADAGGLRLRVALRRHAHAARIPRRPRREHAGDTRARRGMSLPPEHRPPVPAPPPRGAPVTTTDPDSQRRVLNRLRRARGQLNAVIDAVEAGGSCREVVTQLSAVSAALDRAGFTIIATAMKDCVADPEGVNRGEGITTDELEKLFLTLA